MSGDFTPTSVEEITRMATTYVPDSILGALSRTALAWLAERDALQADTFRAERDAVTAERDQLRSDLEGEQKSRRRLDAQLRAELHISSDTSLMPVLRERLTEWGKLSRAKKAAEEARDLAIVERDEAYKQRDAMRAERDAAVERAESCEEDVQSANRAAHNARRARERARDEVSALESQIDDARAILGAAAGDLLSDAAERAACAVKHEANAMDIIGRTLGHKVVGGADVAVIHASEEIDRLRERVKALVGAERERDRLLRSEADVCKILGAAPEEPLSDAARRVVDAGPHKVVLDAVRDVLGLRLGDPVVDRVRALANDVAILGKHQGWVIEALGWSADKQMGDLWQHAEDVATNLRVATRKLAEADEVRAILQTPSLMSTRERAKAVMASLAAEAEPPQVFRIQHEITIAGDLVTIRVAPLRDPAIRALPLGVRLGLVVCDE